MQNTKLVENPHTKNKFLRFCVGTVERRNMSLPKYRDKEITVSHHTESLDTVDIFVVRGFGDTIAKAEWMALKANVRRGM